MSFEILFFVVDVLCVLVSEFFISIDDEGFGICVEVFDLCIIE